MLNKVQLPYPKVKITAQHMKKTSLAKLIELKGTYELSDIWRVRNAKSRFTFTQKHFSGFIQLDYISISNTLQEFVTMTEILTLISTDHSHVLLSHSK